MVSLLKSAIRFYKYIDENGADERMKDWFLVDSPAPGILILVSYYLIVKSIGPAVMESKKPFKLDKIIQVYNILQVILCGWLSFEAFRLTYGPNGTYNWACQPMDKSRSPLAIKIGSLTYYYYLIKVFDLLDTVFFLLRKKYNQITFLHVYHHMGVVIMGYIASRYYPDGQGFLIIMLNSFVHCFMYLYYFLTIYNSEYKKKIWWKKYITQLQLLQFLILAYHYGKTFFMPTCQYPALPLILFLPHNVLMVVLFSNFYKNAYLTPKKSVKVE